VSTQDDSVLGEHTGSPLRIATTVKKADPKSALQNFAILLPVNNL
jgi:hypothetical protein